MELPTVPHVPTEPSPMPDPCSGELDAVMLGEALPFQAIGGQWQQPTHLRLGQMGMTWNLSMSNRG